jgi:hypothetical protein
MPRGGKRPNAGRKARPTIPLEANKRIATEVLSMVGYDIGHITPDKNGKGPCDCELCTWFELLHESGDLRLRFDVLKYLTDRRDGKAVQTVNHVHDKPIEMNVTVSLAESVQKARKRAMEA